MSAPRSALPAAAASLRRRAFVAGGVAGAVAGGAAFVAAPLGALPRADPPPPAGAVPFLDSRVAGLGYGAPPAALAGLRPGDAVRLRRERDHPFDARTVAVVAAGARLGQLPGIDARAVAGLIDAGTPVTARVAAIGGIDDGSPRPRMRLTLYVGGAEPPA